MSNVYSLALFSSLLLAGCPLDPELDFRSEVETDATVAPADGVPLVYFTEHQGGTCGDIAPIETLDEVCAQLDLRLALVRYQPIGDLDRWVKIACDGALQAYMSFDRRALTGVFDLARTDCASSYALRYE